ncbi:hypothetical protein K458DRAFT_479554 [Lentithecium fluviatile CBS 122367]|uniref:Uncharacterized protein n=1 Tax=Lentithecium fluviatile CBS 122367 TaxID=1168545 RepID=A0A6G1IT08_9PLEO|nr:hypothetical protein K458DRAFT_479554 [Lentithecium fluviatile CBS 122367]
MDATACTQCLKTAAQRHKKVCATNSASSLPIEHAPTTAPRAKNLEKHIANPFTRLESCTYLHDRSEKDVFKLLIDSFHMRQADAFKSEDRKETDSVYTGAPSSIEGFRNFMRLASSRCGLLRPHVDKGAVMAHYGEQKLPMQLHMFAGVYESLPARIGPGTAIRKMKASMEAGPNDGRAYSMMGL